MQHDVDLCKMLEGAGTDLVISDDTPNKGCMAEAGEVFTNTGTFGFKNTAWALEFAKVWWGMPMGKERVLYHEQDVLGKLYRRDTLGLRAGSRCSPYNRMNSAYGELPRGGGGAPEARLRKTFVLHMMKSSKDRRRVFDQVDAMVTRSAASRSRPLHVVDLPDHNYGVKPLSSGSGTAAPSTAAWAAAGAAVLALLFLAALLLWRSRAAPQRRRR